MCVNGGGTVLREKLSGKEFGIFFGIQIICKLLQDFI